MRALIVEDEILAVKRLRKLISDTDKSIIVQDHVGSIEEFLNWYKNHDEPDIIFLDIHLEDGLSLELFQLIEINAPIIFTTAYDQYAIDAFKVSAIDYLLKPIKSDELKSAIDKIKLTRNNSNFNYGAIAELLQPKRTGKRFLVKIGQTIKLVDLDEAAYLYTQDKITFLITHDGKRYPIDYSLDKLEDIADPDQFFRINRQYIINLEAIKEMHSYSKSRVKVILTPPCNDDTIVSTERSPHFKKWLLKES